MLTYSIEDIDEDFKSGKNIEQAFLYLKNLGFIKAGMVIPGDKTEEALGIKYEDSWKFLGPMLELKSRIESENFFTTQRGLEAPSLRILESEEMAGHAHKKLKNVTHQIGRTADIMLGHDITKLEENAQKKHNYELRKVAEAALFNQKILYKRNFV